MWTKFVNWHRDWEAEQIAILENPALAETLPQGIRRFSGLQTAKMSVIERRQMLDFSLKYRGRRLYIAFAKLLVLFSLGGIMFHLALPKTGILEALFVTNTVGVGLVVFAFGAYFNYRRLVGKGFVIVMLMVFLCGSVGYVVGAGMAARDRGISVSAALKERWFKVLWAGGGIGVAFMLPMGVIAIARNHQYHKLLAQLEIDTERERNARELSESRLRLLHAQIEPHFLFNTLGAVQQLADRDAPKAAALTGHLIDFLRASMNQMRSESITLEADFALIEAYLQVMKARLGERLSYSLHLPPQLATVELPSMLLLTLVENSIKHGIEPALRGGDIQVSAERCDAGLRLTVRDGGAGLAATPGEGEGLNNVRKRLQLKYGPNAGVSITNGPEHGAVARIILPIEESASA